MFLTGSIDGLVWTWKKGFNFHFPNGELFDRLSD